MLVYATSGSSITYLRGGGGGGGGGGGVYSLCEGDR